MGFEGVEMRNVDAGQGTLEVFKADLFGSLFGFKTRPYSFNRGVK
jgi:hypothetical protein